MARTRTFLALDIGDAVRGNAVAMQSTLAATGAAVKWAHADTLHLTLLYLGDLEDRDLANVCRKAKSVAAQCEEFRMAFGGLGAFPNSRRPKIVWAGLIDGIDEVTALAAALAAALEEAGLYRPEDRPYRPHLTLGRVNDDDSSQLLAAELPKHAAWKCGAVAVSEVHVMASDLKRSGPEYSVIARLPLG
jgi:2'-5' RNA ligase